MKKIVFIAIFVPVLSVLALVSVKAGIGVSPPTIIRDNLKPGSTYTKTITFSQSDPREELSITLEKDLGDIDSWVSFNPGSEFVVPAGESQYAFDLIINVPEDAELANHKGYVRLKVAPTSDAEAGGVSVVTGARIDINLSITDKDEVEFLVRALELPDNLDSSRLVLTAKIENLGNVEAAPSRAMLDIKTLNEQNVAVYETTSIPAIPPGETKEVEIVFDNVSLNAGEYYVDTYIYHEAEELRKERLVLRVDSDITGDTSVSDITVEGSVKDSLILVFSILLPITVIITVIYFLYLRKRQYEEDNN